MNNSAQLDCVQASKNWLVNCEAEYRLVRLFWSSLAYASSHRFQRRWWGRLDESKLFDTATISRQSTECVLLVRFFRSSASLSATFGLSILACFWRRTWKQPLRSWVEKGFQCQKKAIHRRYDDSSLVCRISLSGPDTIVNKAASFWFRFKSSSIFHHFSTNSEVKSAPAGKRKIPSSTARSQHRRRVIEINSELNRCSCKQVVSQMKNAARKNY